MYINNLWCITMIFLLIYSPCPIIMLYSLWCSYKLKKLVYLYIYSQPAVPWGKLELSSWLNLFIFIIIFFQQFFFFYWNKWVCIFYSYEVSEWMQYSKTNYTWVRLKNALILYDKINHNIFKMLAIFKMFPQIFHQFIGNI